MTKAQELAERQAVIDRFGEVDRLAKLWTPQVNPYLKEKAELISQMEAWYVDHPAEQGDLVDGLHYQVEVKPCQNERELTPEGLSKAFYKMRSLKVLDDKGKPARFDPFTVFGTTLAAIQKHLGEKFLDSIAPKKPTGGRRFIPVALEKAA